MKKTVCPWELIEDKDISQLVFAYEAILAEMRTYARDPHNRQIKEWVSRLDFERDEFVSAMVERAEAHKGESRE